VWQAWQDSSAKYNFLHPIRVCQGYVTPGSVSRRSELISCGIVRVHCRLNISKIPMIFEISLPIAAHALTAKKERYLKIPGDTTFEPACSAMALRGTRRVKVTHYLTPGSVIA
jgi:hypothetical protein